MGDRSKAGGAGLIGRVLGAALAALGVWGTVSGDPRLLSGVALGGIVLPARLLAALGAGLGGVIAFLPRPLLPMLLVDGTLLVAGLVRYAGTNWTHVIWGSSPPAHLPPPTVALSALLIPAGILLAHAEAHRSAALRSQAARGLAPAAPSAGLAAALLAAALAVPLAVAARAPTPVHLGPDLSALALAVALAAAVAGASGALRPGGGGSTSPRAPRSGRAP